MRSRVVTWTKDDEPLSEDELPDEADTDDAVEVVRCRECGRLIAEDAPQCPNCKTWGAADDLGGSHVARRIAWGLLVFLLIGVILVMWHGLGR